MKSLVSPKTPVRKIWRRRTGSWPSSFTLTRISPQEPQMLLKVPISGKAVFIFLCTSILTISKRKNRFQTYGMARSQPLLTPHQTTTAQNHVSFQHWHCNVPVFAPPCLRGQCKRYVIIFFLILRWPPLFTSSWHPWLTCLVKSFKINSNTRYLYKLIVQSYTYSFLFSAHCGDIPI